LPLLLIPISIVSGLIEEQGLKHNEAIHEVLIIHKYNAFIMLFFYQILALWYWTRNILMKRPEYIGWVCSLLLLTTLVIYQGYLGGRMVFELGAGVKPMEMLIEEEGDDSHSHGEKKETNSQPALIHKNGDHEREKKAHDHSHSKESNVKMPHQIKKDTLKEGSIEKTDKSPKQLKDMKY
jgi:hypothetical protein